MEFHMPVPNEMRGRIMGFYGMTWNIMPLGGMFAGALAVQTGTHWAVAIGGFIVAGFTLGPALMSSKVRNLGQIPPNSRTTQHQHRSQRLSCPLPSGRG